MDNIVKCKDVDMTSGNLFKKIFIFALPIMISALLQLFYSAADLIVCGQFGSINSVAAISNTGSIINLIVELFIGLSVGSNVLMTRAYSLKDKDKAHKILNTSVIFSLFIGIIIGIFGYFMSEIFLKWMKTPNDVIDLSASYLKIYFLGLPFQLLYNFGAACQRACGDTKKPFYILAFAGIFNIGFNFLFVIGLNLDVKGVAIATVISQIISGFLILILLIKGNSLYKFNLKTLFFDLKELKNITRIGIPAGIQSAVFSIANILIQSSVNSLGTIVMDADGASSSIEGFVYVCMNAIAQACLVFISSNYALGKKENIKKIIIYSTAQCLAISLIIGSLIIIFGKQLLGFYTSNEEAVKIGYLRLLILVSTYSLCGLLDIFSFSVRGLGYSLLPMIITAFGCCVYRIIWVLTIFKIERFHTNLTLSLCYPISWLMTSALHLISLIIIYRRLKFDYIEMNN